MFIHTDFLRAALCCVADYKEERRYLQGVHITSTHIQACNGHACVSMEHGCPDAFKGVFIFLETIPDEADGSYIKVLNDGALVVEHVTEDNRIICRGLLESVRGRYPDFSKLLSGEPEPCDTIPTFQAKYLALPHLMFGRDTNFVPVQFRSWGKEKPCQLMFDKTLNYMYGNPLLIIMPMTDDTFEKLGQVFDAN